MSQCLIVLQNCKTENVADSHNGRNSGVSVIPKNPPKF